jgi:hypothetical protein
MRKLTVYNGWANYATWRIFDDTIAHIDFDHQVTPEELKEIVTDMVLSNFEMQIGSHLVEEYAELYINTVDFNDIAETINLEVWKKL